MGQGIGTTKKEKKSRGIYQSGYRTKERAKPKGR
jgi:hypothetical protein